MRSGQKYCWKCSGKWPQQIATSAVSPAENIGPILHARPTNFLKQTGKFHNLKSCRVGGTEGDSAIGLRSFCNDKITCIPYGDRFIIISALFSLVGRRKEVFAGKTVGRIGSGC